MKIMIILRQAHSCSDLKMRDIKENQLSLKVDLPTPKYFYQYYKQPK